MSSKHLKLVLIIVVFIGILIFFPFSNDSKSDSSNRQTIALSLDGSSPQSATTPSRNSVSIEPKSKSIPVTSRNGDRQAIPIQVRTQLVEPKAQNTKLPKLSAVTPEPTSPLSTPEALTPEATAPEKTIPDVEPSVTVTAPIIEPSVAKVEKAKVEELKIEELKAEETTVKQPIVKTAPEPQSTAITAEAPEIVTPPSNVAKQDEPAIKPGKLSATDYRNIELELGQRYQLNLALPESELLAEAPKQLHTKTVEVQSGDSFALLVQRAGLSPRVAYDIDRLGEDTKRLRRLHPGDKLTFSLDEAQQFQKLEVALSSTERLIVSHDGQAYQHRIEEKEIEVRQHFAHGEITSSFWNAGISAGIQAGVIMDLAGIFGWDIDFALDIRQGDSFTVIYEQHFINGLFQRNGNIIAAEFRNQGDIFRAYRHSNGNYYTPKGRSMRKAFLRAPVNFRYISSSFNPRRLHPVTGKVRAHNGIDYVAARGTPIMASGDGRVSQAGYNKYNGNYVFIQHSSAYTTKYLHLNKRHVKTGQRVKQGQTIGTMGATGRVTGVHLHYEFLVNGVHRNPRTVKLPQSKSLTGDDKAAYLVKVESLEAQLNNTQRVLLAMKGEAD